MNEPCHLDRVLQSHDWGQVCAEPQTWACDCGAQLQQTIESEGTTWLFFEPTANACPLLPER